MIKPSFKTNSGYPEFGLVSKMAVKDKALYFSVTSCRTVCFNDHFHSFQVETLSLPENLVLIKFETLPDCEPLWILQNFKEGDATCFVSPRHWV